MSEYSEMGKGIARFIVGSILLLSFSILAVILQFLQIPLIIDRFNEGLLKPNLFIFIGLMNITLGVLVGTFFSCLNLLSNKHDPIETMFFTNGFIYVLFSVVAFILALVFIEGSDNFFNAAYFYTIFPGIIISLVLAFCFVRNLCRSYSRWKEEKKLRAVTIKLDDLPHYEYGYSKEYFYATADICKFCQVEIDQYEEVTQFPCYCSPHVHWNCIPKNFKLKCPFCKKHIRKFDL